mmetsp:Transcript_25442/g.69957  ORF Transcript_25442/g.69957 Transcript_25442/m.69957 type:complete len:206 (+) Transcript_25442:789-1406(+)
MSLNWASGIRWPVLFRKFSNSFLSSEPLPSLSRAMKAARKSSTSLSFAWCATSMRTTLSKCDVSDQEPNLEMILPVFSWLTAFLTSISTEVEGLIHELLRVSMALFRMAGSLTNKLRIKVAADVGTLALLRGSSRKGDFNISVNKSAIGLDAAFFANGCSLVYMMYNMTPSDQTSHLVPYFMDLSMTSGATKNLVPRASDSQASS